MKEIVYLKHPVSPEQKAKVVSEGKRIVDIRFKPKSDDKGGQGNSTKKAATKKADE